uniref:Uncharacterized protein n=1 Tax=viral metagenome TaxID=1070528 RepID=A0A6M3KZB6_9ZZZZ
MTVLSYLNPDNVPNAVKNTALKYAYTYIVQELLRLKRNEVGADFRDGLITEQEWQSFLRNWYEPRSNVVINDLLELRQICKDYVIQFKDKINLEGIPI